MDQKFKENLEFLYDLQSSILRMRYGFDGHSPLSINGISWVLGMSHIQVIFQEQDVLMNFLIKWKNEIKKISYILLIKHELEEMEGML